MLLQWRKYTILSFVCTFLCATMVVVGTVVRPWQGAHAQSTSNPLVTVAGAQWGNNIGIYHPGDTPQITVKLQNKQGQATSGDVKVSLVSGTGKVLWQGTSNFSLPASQAGQVTITTTKLSNSGWFNANITAEVDGAAQSSYSAGVAVMRTPSASTQKAATGVQPALAPRPTGLLPNSYFGLGVRTESDQDMNRQIAQQMGVRWQRGVNNCDMGTVEPSNGTYWTQDQINACRGEIQAWNNAGIEIIGTPWYGPCWNTDSNYPCYSKPLDMNVQADAVYHYVSATQDLIQNYELHNEPWIHGWAWANGDAQDYRNYTKAIWDRVKADYPNVNLIGGGSVPFNRDIVYAKGATNAGYMDGSVNHAYGFPDPGQSGDTATQAAMDKLWSQTKGRAGEWQTELGTREADFPGLSNTDQRLWVARTLAPTYMLQILGATSQGQPIHVFWFSLGYNANYSGDDYNIYDGTNPKPAVSAYSIMTQALEGKTMVGDIYDKSKGVWAFLFQDANGNGSVALYADQNYNGSISLSNTNGIEAYDYLGDQISDGSQSSLNITLNSMEMKYFVSNRPVNDIKALFQNATIKLNTEVKVSPLSLTHPVDNNSTIDLKLQNTTNQTINATASVSAPSGWTLSTTSQAVNNLAPGEIRVISFPASSVSVASNNQYTVNYTLTTGDGTQETGSQVIQVAYAPKQTVPIDGNLSNWSNAVPVTTGSGHYQLQTAWDDNYFYVGASIDDANPVENKPFSQDPYAFPFDAHGIQLAFDVIPHNPEDLLYGQSEYEKAFAADIDYEFDAVLASDGTPELYRLQAPGTNYQTYYPTNPTLTPPLAPIDASPSGGSEGKIQIVRNGNKTIYELAFAWKTLPDVQNIVKNLPAGQGTTMNFAFAVTGGDGGTAYWTQEAGQVESGAYGFSPHWGAGQAKNGGRIITRWGLVNGQDCGSSCGGGTPTPTPTPTSTPTATPTPTSGLPSPWKNQDVGSVSSAGSSSYSSGTFTVAGSGADIWGTADGFQYAYQSLNGDGTIVARVASQQNTNGWAKAGVMIRSSLTAGSPHAFMAITPGNGAAFQYRSSSGGNSSNTNTGSWTAPTWVKLVRSGNTFTGSVSSDGSSWTQIGSTTISMGSSAYVGLAVTSHNDGTLSTATFDNVSVTTGSGSTPTPTPTPTSTPTSGSLVVAINAGGAATGNFVADTDVDQGNQYSDTSTSIDTSGVTNPAPQAVYQTCRWNSAFTYTIPNLTAGASYKVRLHWAELSFQANGSRLFNVAINGSSVLSKFDVYATAGYKKALVKEFTVTANSSGQIVIAFTQGGADNPFISGIEVYTA